MRSNCATSNINSPKFKEFSERQVKLFLDELSGEWVRERDIKQLASSFIQLTKSAETSRDYAILEQKLLEAYRFCFEAGGYHGALFGQNVTSDAILKGTKFER